MDRGTGLFVLIMIIAFMSAIFSGCTSSSKTSENSATTQDGIEEEEPTDDTEETEEEEEEEEEEVQPQVSTLVIKSAANGAGETLADSSNLTSGTEYSYYIAAYDENGNYMSDVDATCASTGSLSSRISEASSGAITISPWTAGTGAMTFTYENISLSFQSLTVVPGALASIKVASATDDEGSEVTDPTISTLSDVTYYASGYDSAGNYKQDYDGTWSAGGALSDSITDHEDGSVTINTSDGGTGTLSITASELSDDVGTITVNMNVPDSFADLTDYDTLKRNARGRKKSSNEHI